MATINSGKPIVLRIVPMTKYVFGGATGLANNGTMTITLAKHIDLTPFTEVDLVVRFHSGTTSPLAANQTFVVQIVNDGYDFEDPATDFFQTAPVAGGAGSVLLNNASPSVRSTWSAQ